MSIGSVKAALQNKTRISKSEILIQDKDCQYFAGIAFANTLPELHFNSTERN